MLPSTTELLVIFGVLILLFGANKLPRLGGAFGESLKNFKKGLRGDQENEEADTKNLKQPES